MKRHPLIFAMIVLLPSVTRADFLMRIGDKDGFGYNQAAGFKAANGGLANRGGSNVLSNGDFLPDLNGDGFVATGKGDDFDLRSSSEVANNAVSASTGVTNTAGTTGSKFTDIALSTSYDKSSANGQVLTGGTAAAPIYGTGGAFPFPSSTVLPHQPGFVFNFDVSKSSLNASSNIFFNLVFGDYDVTPATIKITRANGSTSTLGLRQQDNTTSDGLIQNATADLAFGDVFTDGGSVWHGKLNVDFIAPNEPYTAFDYVELSTSALVSSVPEPSGLILLGTGMVGLGCFSWIGKSKWKASRKISVCRVR